MEKVNLTCGRRGFQEVTSGAIIVSRSSFFSVKKVYE